ncbi:MAG: DUF92 domain-containing protein [Thermoplasmatales archaeon]
MDPINSVWLVTLFLFPAIVGSVSYVLHLVSKGGAGSIFLIGLGVYLGLGLSGILYLILILYSASLITIYGSRKRGASSPVKPKRGPRDFWRIMGGGGLGGLIGFLVFFKLLSLHTGTIGLVTAFGITSSDTWASSIGILSKKEPVMIIPPWNRVETGTSGAISVLGEIFSVIGGSISLIFAYVSGLMGQIKVIELVFMLVVIMGEKLDSFLGATIQGSYYYDKYNLHTVNSVHSCRARTTIIRGSRYVTNSGVNLLTTIIGATTIMSIF